MSRAVPALLVAAVGLLLSGSASMAAAEQQPLEDPIPAKIQKGDIIVEAIDFIRLPKTRDSNPTAANTAYARIQYLLPLRDGSKRLFINDLRGLLYVTDENGKAPVVFIDLRKQDISFDDSMFPNETGLAGFAFHPQFSDKGKPGFGKLYIAYSARSDSGIADYLEDNAASHESVIREWTVDDPGADVFAGSSREVFRIGQFSPNHNIGTLAFNPNAKPGSADFGMLYASIGDGGAAYDPYDYGQSLKQPMAGIMRIDVSGITKAGEGKAYRIPPDNPFVNHPDIASEIWASGLRHAQQFSWDTDGRMFITDIGQNQVEEVNLGFPGANYGWRLREGTFATPFAIANADLGPVYQRPLTDPKPFVYPVAQYDHDEGNAISSGFVYRGSSIAELYGKYVFSELVRGRVFYIDTTDLRPGYPAQIRELRIILGGRERNILDISGYPNTYAPGNRVGLRLGIDAAGELYLLTKGDGWIRKLVPAREQSPTGL